MLLRFEETDHATAWKRLSLQESEDQHAEEGLRYPKATAEMVRFFADKKSIIRHKRSTILAKREYVQHKNSQSRGKSL